LDFDQFNCGYYVWDDIYGSYCYMWLLSENNPSVNAYVRLQSSATEWKGFVEDWSHATVNYNFSPSSFGVWAGTANHYVQQHGYVMYCPYNFCTGWIPVAYNQYYLGHTEAEHTIKTISVGRYTSGVSLTDTDVDNILASATELLQTNDGSDVACPITFRREGSVSVFSVGDGTISDEPELVTVLGAPGRVQVVNAIPWCVGSPPAGLHWSGCSSGLGIAVIREPANKEGTLWAHEYGHNQSFLDSGSLGFVMHNTLNEANRKVTQSQCNGMRNPLN